jgi:hypothetical protein
MKNYWLERKNEKASKACEKSWKRIETSTTCCDWIMTYPEVTSVWDATTATWAPPSKPKFKGKMQEAAPCNKGRLYPSWDEVKEGNNQTFHIDVPPGWTEDAFVEKIKAEFSKGGGHVI